MKTKTTEAVDLYSTPVYYVTIGCTVEFTHFEYCRDYYFTTKEARDAFAMEHDVAGSLERVVEVGTAHFQERTGALIPD